MRLSLATLAAIMGAAAAGLLAGCNGAGDSDTTRARLIAVENRKLTQQVQEQSQRIAQLEAELARVKKETQEQIEQVNKATGEILGPLMTMHQELQAENERLKKELGQQ
jgi:uncharacterized small protein (DUF1192 family)